MKPLYAPKGEFSNEDAASKQRKTIAEMLRQNQEVAITPSGQVEENDPNDDSVKLVAPNGKFAS